MGKKNEIEIETFVFIYRDTDPLRNDYSEMVTGRFTLSYRLNLEDKIPMFDVKALVVEVNPMMDSNQIKALCVLCDSDFDTLKENVRNTKDVSLLLKWKYQSAPVAKP